MKKICSKCKIEKETSEFYKCKSKKDGLRCWCKECGKLDNEKREKQYNEKRRQYRLTHKEEARQNKKRYYDENKEKILKINSIWRQTINGRYTSYRNSAKFRKLEWELTKEEFIKFWDNNCYYCGDKIDGIGIDRLDSNIGYKVENLVPCCSICNVIKMDYSYNEFINKITKIYNHLNLKNEREIN